MKPYFEGDGVRLYHGDAREILPTLPRADSIITDPVWPNTLARWKKEFGNPYVLFREVMRLVPAAADRLTVHLGGGSDPRFLRGVPARMPFLGVTWLRYALPSFRGRMMIGADVAYSYGKQPTAGCVPSEGTAAQPARHGTGHPCARRPEHVQFLVKWLAGESLIDPFAGSGTTLHACMRQGVRAVGIEIREDYCEAAARRLSQRQLRAEATR